MDLVFAGTPAFSVPTLEALLAARHNIRAVFTQPDRPAGRGQKSLSSPVKQLALRHGLAVEQPATLKESAGLLRDLRPDAMIVVAYGLLLPRDILPIPRLGCINVHASLLPRWRGAAPIQRAIEAGDAETGITIMQMAAGLDTGEILSQAAIPIIGADTAASLHDKLAVLGGELLVRTLTGLDEGTVSPVPQDDHYATYATKLTKAEAHIDWSLSALSLSRKVRAFNPWPVAQTRWCRGTLRIWMAQPEGTATPARPGTVLSASADGVRVATGEGILVIHELQAEGGKRLPAAAFLNGNPIATGELLG